MIRNSIDARRLSSAPRKTLCSARWLGAALFLLVPAACSTREEVESDIAFVQQAVSGADCGYAVSSEIHGVSKKGFHAKIVVTISNPATRWKRSRSTPRVRRPVTSTSTT